MDKVHFLSTKDEWETPEPLFYELDEEFQFDMDVCASDTNWKVPTYITKEEDALTMPWAPQTCWMNPPYGKEIGKWIQKAYDEAALGSTVVCLVPARTDTKWWAIFWDHENHRLRRSRDEVRFIRGRLKFKGAPASAPFPSAIIVMRP